MQTQRRSSDRLSVTAECTLARRSGSPIPCRTVDVSSGGMRIASPRPLSIDEVLEFHLAVNGSQLNGAARVLRMQAHNEYALRFENVQADAAKVLAEVLRSESI